VGSRAVVPSVPHNAVAPHGTDENRSLREREHRPHNETAYRSEPLVPS